MGRALAYYALLRDNERRHRILWLAKQETGETQILASNQTLKPMRGKLGACEIPAC